MQMTTLVVDCHQLTGRISEPWRGQAFLSCGQPRPFRRRPMSAGKIARGPFKYIEVGPQQYAPVRAREGQGADVRPHLLKHDVPMQALS